MNVFQKILVLFFSLFFLCPPQIVFAQKKLKSGAVVYEITNVETSIPELKLMKGTKKTLFFTPDQQKINVSLNNETIKIHTVYNSRTQDVLAYYDFMGKQFKVSSNRKDAPKVKSPIKDIDYQKSIGKSIAGYQCFKAEITFEDEKVVVWLTDRIKTTNPDFQSLFPGLVGFPLEYVRRSENTKMTFTAKFITEIVPADTFEMSKTYQLISEKEFNERMGGMKFGF